MSTTPSHTADEQSKKVLGIPRNQLAGVAVGQVVEWFDWTAYALLAVYFSHLFFPKDADPLTSLLGTFGIMAVGFIVRPLSGLVVSTIADRFGRRPALLFTIWGMGIASLIIGIAPTYEQVGVLAPIILLLARIVQGVAIGGEFSSTAALAMESAGEGRRGWVAAQFTCFGYIGQIAVIVMVAAFSFILSPEAMGTWGWRVIFIFGALLSVLGVFLRRHMQDTVDTSATQKTFSWAAIFEPMRKHPKQTIQVVGLTVGFTAMVYAWGSYFPTYAHTYHGLDLSWGNLSLLIANFVNIVAVLIAGKFSDRYGRKPVMITAGVLLTLITVPALGLLNDSILRLILVQSVGNALVASLQAAVVPLYSELFPKKFRAAGFGFPYAFTVGVIGGTVPLIGTQLASMGLENVFPWYLVVLMAISTMFYIGAKETAFKPLPE
ncbi:MFS transporter [Corynebacterium sp. S7]